MIIMKLLEGILNSNERWNKISCISFINQPVLAYSHKIRNAVLLIYSQDTFTKDAFQRLIGNNKELMLIPNAVHTDLYDNLEVSPFDKMSEFFKTYLK